jgi:hypothetical protein
MVFSPLGTLEICMSLWLCLAYSTIPNNVTRLGEQFSSLLLTTSYYLFSNRVVGSSCEVKRISYVRWLSELFSFPLVQYTVSSRASLSNAYSKSGIDWTPYLIPKVNLVIPLHTLRASYYRSTTCGAQLFIVYTVVPKQLLRGVRGINPIKMTLGWLLV